jgi:hypothetical protein
MEALMQLTTQVVARNTDPRVVVLSLDPKSSDYVEWQAADDMSGGDVQIVSEAISQSVPFIRLCQRGIIVVENMDENPGIAEAIERQNAAWRARSSNSSNQARTAIEQPQQNDMIVQPCIGPNGRGSGTCDVDVMVREKTKNEKPPLCPQHASLAPQYVPSEEQDGTTRVRKWYRATMGTPERQQQ